MYPQLSLTPHGALARAPYLTQLKSGYSVEGGKTVKAGIEPSRPIASRTTRPWDAQYEK